VGDNVYAVEVLASSRLADLRAASARMALLHTARAGRDGWRPALGAVLVRLGTWLVAGAEAANAGVRVAR
jgi:hypothetical protein